MGPSKKHFSVNWVDGMKISKEHFEQSDKYMEESIRDAIHVRLSSFNYGLLPSDDFSESCDLHIYTKNTELNIEVKACRAITQFGTRIDINANNYGRFPAKNVTASFDTPPVNQKYNIVVGVDYDTKVAIDSPSVKEMPPRHPYNAPNYTIELVEADNINWNDYPSDFAIVGRIAFKQGTFILDKDYVPPCTCLSSHETLFNYFRKWKEGISKIEGHIREIVRKIHEKSDKRSALVQNVLRIMDKTAHYFAANLGQYYNLLPYRPPIEGILFFQQWANITKTALEMMPYNEREALLKHFANWTLSSTRSSADYTKTLDNLINMDYDHTSCMETIQLVDNFMTAYVYLFEKLSDKSHITDKDDGIIIKTTTIEEKPVEAPITKTLIKKRF